MDLIYRAEAITLRVTDDGAGFDPTAGPTDPSPVSGGFGMASMQKRARLVGGTVVVRSPPGIGTRVEAHIPYHARREEKPELASTEPAVSDGAPTRVKERIRVLVVDGQEVVRQGIRSMLEHSEGIDIVGETSDGEEALRQIEVSKPDVTPMDVQMRGIDGVTAVRRLKSWASGHGLFYCQFKRETNTSSRGYVPEHNGT